MTEKKKYTTPDAFRAALEARVKRARKENESLEMAHRKISFEAFLLRIKPSGCAVISNCCSRSVRNSSLLSQPRTLRPAKMETKARSLRDRIGKCMRDGIEFKIKTTVSAPSQEIGSPNELAVKEENNPSIEAIEKKGWRLGLLQNCKRYDAP